MDGRYSVEDLGVNIPNVATIKAWTGGFETCKALALGYRDSKDLHCHLRKMSKIGHILDTSVDTRYMSHSTRFHARLS